MFNSLDCLDDAEQIVYVGYYGNDGEWHVFEEYPTLAEADLRVDRLNELAELILSLQD